MILRKSAHIPKLTVIEGVEIDLLENYKYLGAVFDLIYGALRLTWMPFLRRYNDVYFLRRIKESSVLQNFVLSGCCLFGLWRESGKGLGGLSG